MLVRKVKEEPKVFYFGETFYEKTKEIYKGMQLILERENYVYSNKNVNEFDTSANRTGTKQIHNIQKTNTHKHNIQCQTQANTQASRRTIKNPAVSEDTTYPI